MCDTLLRVVQISDSHLTRDATLSRNRVNAEKSLSAVMALIQQEQTMADLFLVTGDVSQDGSFESYQRFAQRLTVFEKPVCVLPGNHDDFTVMQSVMSEHVIISPCVKDLQGWRVIMLNSATSDDRYGELLDDELFFLERALRESALHGVEHCMVCLHHHPVPLNSRWLDREGLRNANRFFEVLDHFDHVRAVVWGHVHQEFQGRRRDVELFSAPSTCYQIKPGEDVFALDALNPGYRWFDLYSNGRIKSAVSRVREHFFG